MYRFRTIYGLLDGFNELENQEIYFADFESLNDPMEGFRNYIWKGDSVLWRNLFKHYLLTFFLTNMSVTLENDNYIFSDKDINVFADETKFSGTGMEIIQKVYEDFFATASMNELIEWLGNGEEFDEETLLFIFSGIHYIAIESVFEKIHKPLIENEETGQRSSMLSVRELVDILTKFKSGKFDEHKIAISEIVRTSVWFYNAQNLQIQHHSRENINNRSRFILFNYPEAYMKAIKKMVYPEAYVACFMEDCSNPAMWGYYGDSHKGVCLKFKTHAIQGKECIPLELINGISGDGFIKSINHMPFSKIKYNSTYGDIYFFQNIGVLPPNQIISQWYKDENGNFSSLAAPLLKNDEEYMDWHQKYWEIFHDGYKIKLKDWEYEKEHRLILHSSLGFYNHSEHRKIKYEFEDLEAIIFGIKTSLEDKLKIMNIIETKCKKLGRKKFDFYQAKYSATTGKIDTVDLMIGKYEV